MGALLKPPPSFFLLYDYDTNALADAGTLNQPSTVSICAATIIFPEATVGNVPYFAIQSAFRLYGVPAEANEPMYLSSLLTKFFPADSTGVAYTLILALPGTALSLVASVSVPPAATVAMSVKLPSCPVVMSVVVCYLSCT